MKRIYFLLGAVLIVMLSLIPINAFAATVTCTFHQVDMSGIFNSDAYTGGQSYTNSTAYYYRVNPGTTYSDPDYGNVPMDMREAGQNNVWLSHGNDRTSTFPQQITLTTDIQNAATIWLVGFDAGWGSRHQPVEVKYKLDDVDTTITYTPNDWTVNGSGDENLVLWVDHRDIGSAYGDISVARIILPHAGYLTEITVTDPEDVDPATSFPIFAITVAEAVIPAVDAGPDATINEGDTFASSGSFADPDSEDWTATVDYGDGSGVQSLNLNTDKTFDLSHIYADNDVYIVTVTVTDDDGGVGSDTAEVTVLNVAPTVTINGAPSESVTEGTQINLTCTVTDPGADEYTYAWSVTKNGNPYCIGLNDHLSFTPDDNGTYVVSLTVTDDDGGSGTDSKTINVTNVAPTVTIDGAPESSPEGTEINLTCTVTDPGTADTFTYAWSVTKDSSPYGSGTEAAFSFTPDDNGTYIVSLTVTDDDGGAGSDTLTVTVNNVDPEVDAGADQTVDEGDTVSFSGSFTDPGTADTHTIEWTFGDGGTASGTLTPAHVYADNGTYTVTLTVTDDDGGEGSDTLTVTVNNVNPEVDAGADQEVYAGDTINFSGTFTDPGWLDTHIATWNFGDGTSETGTVTEENDYPDSTGTVTGSHIFYNKDTYTVTLTVTDDDGGVGTDTMIVNVLPIPANIEFVPNTLNLKSEGNWVTVFIEFPEGPDGQDWDINEIDADSVRLNGVVPAITDSKYGFVKNSRSESNNGNHRLMLKFDRGLVQGTLEVGESVEVNITGKVMYNGDYADFEGADNIRVINNGSEESNNNNEGNGKDNAPGQNKEPGNNAADGKAVGKDDAPGQNKEPGNNAADGKAIGKENAPGQNKEPGDSANGKAVGKDDAPGQNKEPGDSANGKAKGK